MSERDMLTKTQTLEEMNARYAHLCMKLGDAISRKETADLEIEALKHQIQTLNEEAKLIKEAT